MLMPKKVKYRKQQRGRMAGKAWRGSDVSFGNYGLKALEPCWLTEPQIQEGPGAVVAARPADRGGAWGDARVHQARRQDLGARFPGKADYEEAAGNPNG